MTDQNNGSTGAENDSPAGTPAGFPWSVEHPTPAAEATRPLPPYQQPTPTTSTTAPVRRTGGLTAAVLAGALLLGGAAGVGGAAWQNAWNDDDAAATSAGTTDSSINVNAASLPDGTVEKVAAQVLPSVVKINVTGNRGSGSGSGVVLSSDGNILTNNHVVSVAGEDGTITVAFNDGKTVKAEIVGTDPVTDMAVIRAEGVSGLAAATIGSSDDLQVGQDVVAVGSPYGLNATVTTGIVSALNRPVSVQSTEDRTPQNPFGFGEDEEQNPSGSLSTTYPAIQTDAAINPGNSGGPLVDLAGRVVGINSSIRTAGSGSGSIGLGFSVPIDEVLPIVKQILAGETPTHARLAISVSDVTNDVLAQGALVNTVEANGPADEAGLEKGDVITKVDDQIIESSESLVATIRGHRPDEKVTITYLRDGKERTTEATLGSDAETTAS